MNEIIQGETNSSVELSLYMEHNKLMLKNKLSSTELIEMSNTMRDVLKNVMIKDVHYTTLPGTDKPMLLKPGAEKIITTFQCRPVYDVKMEKIRLPENEKNSPNYEFHREYTVHTTLYKIMLQPGFEPILLGNGVGSCSTLESKYRYRDDLKKTTHKIPNNFWPTYKNDKAKAFKLLPDGTFIKKDPTTGVWGIFEKGGKIENPFIPDLWNTVLKMAKKRSMVDCVITSFSAADIFDLQSAEFDEEDKTIKPPKSNGNGNGKSRNDRVSYTADMEDANFKEDLPFDDAAYQAEVDALFPPVDKPTEPAKPAPGIVVENVTFENLSNPNFFMKKIDQIGNNGTKEYLSAFLKKYKQDMSMFSGPDEEKIIAAITTATTKLSSK